MIDRGKEETNWSPPAYRLDYHLSDPTCPSGHHSAIKGTGFPQYSLELGGKFDGLELKNPTRDLQGPSSRRLEFELTR
ncbi:hypothetical protein PoB_007342900 [Plakobranchus ocellatus]|uniref:Uncharacterized protein n=1 Tax=Plakobranchus ocellatus TaxID=259542 RepID=A0AAV4DRZ4_9GAST|nr:hypothetical protein PoB_007342900 [Plakobranchus ocellatus]